MELDELSAVVKQCNKNLESLGRIASALHEIAMECERMAKEMKAPDVRDDLPEDDDDESLGHPAGPKPDPGEGYREPTEKDIGGDIEVRDSFMDPWQVGTLTKILSDGIGRFRCSHDRSGAVSWNWQFARIKIEPPASEEPPKPPEPEYRMPSLPEDAGKVCEFSDDGESWVKGYLKGFDCDRHWNEGTGWLRAQNFSADRARHRHARIKKD